MRQELIESLGVEAGRLDKVPMETAAGPSIDASADQIEKFAQGLSKGLTFQEMTHNVRALFLSNTRLAKNTSSFTEDPHRHSLVKPQRCTTTCFDCFANLHADVWSRYPAHKLTRSVAAHFLHNNTNTLGRARTHTHTFVLCVWV